MKITKARLKQIIKEELEVTLTNEEAGEMFGESVGTQLEEQELNEDMETLMLNLTPENIAIMTAAIKKVALNFAPAATLATAGYFAKQVVDDLKALSKMAPKDQPVPKGPKGPPPGTVIPMGKDINRDNLD